MSDRRSFIFGHEAATPVIGNRMFSEWPAGQTFTPRLLIIVSFKPSPPSVLIAAPRSSADLSASEKHIHSDQFLFAPDRSRDCGFAGKGSLVASLYSTTLNSCGFSPRRLTTASATLSVRFFFTDAFLVNV